MKFFPTVGILCLCFSSIFAQQPCFNGNSNPTAEAFNMTQLANWDDDELPARFNGEVVYNDIWGYTAPDVNNPNKIREYAIIGSTEKIHIFDITDTENDPANLVEIANFTGGTSAVWRDFKTRGHYAYCVADEGSEGLIILDLSDLPNTVTKVYQSNEFFNRTHNIYIENDRLYVVGQGGLAATTDVIILDIDTDPEQPILLGEPLLINALSNIFNGYVHDIHVKDNIGYCSHINDSVFALWDFTNPANPVLLDAIDTRGLQHSSWLTTDGKYAIYAEETSDTPLGVVDVSNPNEIELKHEIKMPLLASEGHEDNVAHNPFIKGDYLYVSYYEDGVQVFDVSDPLQPSRIGWYDTQRCNTDYNGTDSNWGVYPFFDSNKIIASDTRNGLFVLMLNEDMNTDALPVELAAFGGKLNDDQIQLHWTTHSETRGVRFSIEKQITNNDDWQSLATVVGKGNAAEAVNYTFTDPKPQPGNNIYRLAQLDSDGKVTYSKTVVVRQQKGDTPVLVYPTLVANKPTIDLVWNTDHTTVVVQLFTANGQLAQQSNYQNINSGDRNQLAVAGLTPGVYTLKIQTPNSEWTQRIVKL